MAHPGLILLLAAIVGCVKATPPTTPAAAEVPAVVPEFLAPAPTLPPSLIGKVEVLASDSPEAVPAALGQAIKDAGGGGIYEGWAVRLTEDIAVYRMWNGDDAFDEDEQTNRLGGWWTAAPPSGPVDAYRADYEICDSWNELTWVTTCTLHAGSVVAVGPGQSVSLQTCGDDTPPLEPGSSLAFAQSPEHWQMYIDQPWNRTEALDCSDKGSDYPADPMDLTQRLSD